MDHGIAALALAGVLAYALGRACYVVFYGQLGISPDEVGIDQARSVEAAGLLLAACAAFVLLADSANTFMRRGGWWWPLGVALSLPYLVFAVDVISLGDDAVITTLAFGALYAGLAFLPRAIGVARGLRKPFLRHLNLPGPYALVACLTLIIGGSLTAAWQYGAQAANFGAFSAPPSAQSELIQSASPE